MNNLENQIPFQFPGVNNDPPIFENPVPNENPPQNENPVLEVQENVEEGDKIVIKRVASPKPGFFARWGSFIEFIRYGSSMNDNIHLKAEYKEAEYKVEDKLKCIENPVKKPKPENDNPEIHIEEVPLSPLHVFNPQENVRKKAHITEEKNVEINNRNIKLPHYQKTTYTIDDIYEHTMIDEVTREREEDFWHDKEFKCFTAAGVSLGIVIVALIALPIITAVIVAVIAAAVIALMVYRVQEATPELYAWRDTLHEYYALRQEIGFSQIEGHDGARRLYNYFQSHPGNDLIGKIFHPKEAWKFWQDEWLAFDKKFKELLDKKEFDEAKVPAFFKLNPYSTYTYITLKLNDKEGEHVKHQALATKYRDLKGAFDTVTSNYLDQLSDLALYEKIEKEKKGVYQEKINQVQKEMMNELGTEPLPPGEGEKMSDERKAWIDKRDDVNFLQDYYLNQIDEAFNKRETTFKEWHKNRKNEIENNSYFSQQELVESVKMWWELRQDLEKEDWDSNAIIIPENIQKKIAVKPENLPEPSPFEEVVIKLEGQPLEESGINLEIAANFNTKIYPVQPDEKDKPEQIDKIELEDKVDKIELVDKN